MTKYFRYMLNFQTVNTPSMLEPWHQDTQENFVVPVQRISFGK